MWIGGLADCFLRSGWEQLENSPLHILKPREPEPPENAWHPPSFRIAKHRFGVFFLLAITIVTNSTVARQGMMDAAITTGWNENRSVT